MMNPIEIIDKYYGNNQPLRETLLTHSRLVAGKALACLVTHPELRADGRFVYEAAMLHDIGIFLTDSPTIHCYGAEPYLCHGYLGAKLLREEGLPHHARVAERHTGTGLTVEQIRQRNLPLPMCDYVPESTEEQLVCYADKFFSKTRLTYEKSQEEVADSLRRYGEECVNKFMHWVDIFG